LFGGISPTWANTASIFLYDLVIPDGEMRTIGNPSRAFLEKQKNLLDPRTALTSSNPA
jgi:hypothetical protein